jgi:hypothetical protein
MHCAMAPRLAHGACRLGRCGSIEQALAQARYLAANAAFATAGGHARERHDMQRWPSRRHRAMPGVVVRADPGSESGTERGRRRARASGGAGADAGSAPWALMGRVVKEESIGLWQGARCGEAMGAAGCEQKSAFAGTSKLQLSWHESSLDRQHASAARRGRKT